MKFWTRVKFFMWFSSKFRAVKKLELYKILKIIFYSLTEQYTLDIGPITENKQGIKSSHMMK